MIPKKSVLMKLMRIKNRWGCPVMNRWLMMKQVRSTSGVLVITVLTSPFPKYTDSQGAVVSQTFSCRRNCAYCPSEPEFILKLTLISVD